MKVKKLIQLISADKYTCNDLLRQFRDEPLRLLASKEHPFLP